MFLRYRKTQNFSVWWMSWCVVRCWKVGCSGFNQKGKELIGKFHQFSFSIQLENVFNWKTSFRLRPLYQLFWVQRADQSIESIDVSMFRASLFWVNFSPISHVSELHPVPRPKRQTFIVRDELENEATMNRGKVSSWRKEKTFRIIAKLTESASRFVERNFFLSRQDSRCFHFADVGESVDFSLFIVFPSLITGDRDKWNFFSDSHFASAVLSPAKLAPRRRTASPTRNVNILVVLSRSRFFTLQRSLSLSSLKEEMKIMNGANEVERNQFRVIWKEGQRWHINFPPIPPKSSLKLLRFIVNGSQLILLQLKFFHAVGFSFPHSPAALVRCSP